MSSTLKAISSAPLISINALLVPVMIGKIYSSSQRELLATRDKMEVLDCIERMLRHVIP